MKIFTSNVFCDKPKKNTIVIDRTIKGVVYLVCGLSLVYVTWADFLIDSNYLQPLVACEPEIAAVTGKPLYPSPIFIKHFYLLRVIG